MTLIFCKKQLLHFFLSAFQQVCVQFAQKRLSVWQCQLEGPCWKIQLTYKADRVFLDTHQISCCYRMINWFNLYPPVEQPGVFVMNYCANVLKKSFMQHKIVY